MLVSDTRSCCISLRMLSLADKPTDQTRLEIERPGRVVSLREDELRAASPALWRAWREGLFSSLHAARRAAGLDEH